MLCGNERLLPFSKHYVRCASCKTLVVARMPVADISKVTDDEKDFYGREYWLSHQKKDLGNPDIFDRARMDLPERAVHWLRALIRFKIPPAKVLELGCAHGGFTALLRWAGYEVASRGV